MSYLSGKCDLYDHIYSVGCKGTTDDMSKQEKFEVFKKRTNGVIYMSFPIEVTKANIDLIIAHNHHLKKLEGDTYSYMGNVCKTLKKLNKENVYYNREIKFDTMLDLVPYLPHIISTMSSSENKEYVEIMNMSWPYHEYLEGLEYGVDRSNQLKHYQQKLQEEYRETLTL